MGDRISVVIICKNEAAIIEEVLNAVTSFSDDIVVYDSGSTDGTIEILNRYPLRLVCGEWLGYGKTKQMAVDLAKYDWVLSIDADEAPDPLLQRQLRDFHFSSEKVVYKVRFRNFLGKKWLRWGEWGHDQHIRLFNKKWVNWNEAAIHEELVIPEGTSVKKLQGNILHYTVKDLEEYSHKVVHYAMLNAEKYFKQGKKSGWIKLYLSPAFTFVKHYIFQLGCLDGWLGLVSARMTSHYTFLKYARLRELWLKAGKKG